MADASEPGLGASRRSRSFLLHLVAAGILLFETIYWFARGCTGDFLCEAMLGLFTLAGLVPLAIGIGIWRVTGRVGAVVVADALILGIAGPLLLPSIASPGDIDPGGVPLLALPVALIGGVAGALPRLRGRGGETVAVLALLLPVIVWLGQMDLVYAIAPVVIAVATAVVTLLGRRQLATIVRAREA